MNNSNKIRLIKQIASIIGWRGTTIVFVARALRIIRSYQVRIKKYNLCVHVRPTTDDIWVLWQVFGTLEYGKASVLNLRHILDLGANSGYTSLFLKHHHPASLIIAVEPDPDNFAALVRNVREVSGIIPVHGGISTQDGFLSSISGGNSSSKQFVTMANGKNNEHSDKTVKSYSISTLSENFGVKYWDLIKMDIEGEELSILRSADSLISLTRVLAVELHSWCARECEESINAMADSVKHISKSGETVWIFFK